MANNWLYFLGNSGQTPDLMTVLDLVKTKPAEGEARFDSNGASITTNNMVANASASTTTW